MLMILWKEGQRPGSIDVDKTDQRARNRRLDFLNMLLYSYRKYDVVLYKNTQIFSAYNLLPAMRQSKSLPVC